MQIYDRAGWPRFTWNNRKILAPLKAVRLQQGVIIGLMKGLGFALLLDEAVVVTLTQDVLKSSEIEGERLDPSLVRSSVARHLGLEVGGLAPTDRQVEGVVEMMLDATQNFEQPLSENRLFAWHKALFPIGGSGLTPIEVGAWRSDRNGPMQVVSGPIGRRKVHFEAPPASRIGFEMATFLNWFNTSEGVDDLVLKAALAHLWFVTIHPFDDGNGRIARALADMMLSRSEGSSKRCYSMSAQIQKERSDYYRILEITQKGPLDVTPWIEWFLGCLDRSISGAEATLALVLNKAKFWGRHSGESFNDRQRKVLNRLLDGFDGKLNSSKWAKLAKCSQDTAHRDILDLVRREILAKEAAGGRSTHYVMLAF